MLFAMLQDQHAKQIAQMEASNKANMNSMMERMNAPLAANGGKPTNQPDKEKTPPGGNPSSVPSHQHHTLSSS
jgi:hypothetical protein